MSYSLFSFLIFFFFNDTATTEIYTLSLHDALPISPCVDRSSVAADGRRTRHAWGDRKSTRLNSSHVAISYAVFCLKKKKTQPYTLTPPKTTNPTHQKKTTKPSR